MPGLFSLVLHTHLPWLAHHGRWPVGEEWLYQSWSASYLPLMRVLHTLAGEGRHRLITLGVTPVVNAQLDDPYCLDGMHHWLANWRLRAFEATSVRSAPTSKSAGYQSCTPEALRAFGIREGAEADQALDDFATLWRHGASPLLRSLIDAGTERTLAASVARSRQLASQWCMPSRQYGSSSWALTTGVTPSVIRPRRSSSARVCNTRISGR